ncbi:DUF1232 domain-containing protein [Treponema vincentii]|uniref:YkvA family protein n=1 Tax=Treponema vincentii TaxID=69710 RepID=UPI001BEE414D|nr:YkvA family protein [Treponema vincentii]QUY17440.1 DUF1232 domain-containing protein [Treponema vincentii]
MEEFVSEKFDEKKKVKASEKFEGFKSYQYTDNDFEKVFKNEEKIKEKVKKGNFGEYADYIPLFFEMLKDVFSGKYKEVPVGAIAAIICTLLYILSPIDLILDIIPVIGWLDDIFILGLCIPFVKGDLDKYKTWKQNSKILDEEYAEEK